MPSALVLARGRGETDVRPGLLPRRAPHGQGRERWGGWESPPWMGDSAQKNKKTVMYAIRAAIRAASPSRFAPPVLPCLAITAAGRRAAKRGKAGGLAYAIRYFQYRFANVLMVYP